MNVPIILLFGKTGQLGWALHRALATCGEVIACDRQACDLGDIQQLREIVRTIHPNVIVNAAAYTAVDRAESEPDLARKINGVAPGILAEEAMKIGALLVHYSTDYVFDGRKNGFYVETDHPNPLNAYGLSKLAGEQAIRSVDGAWLIFRTSWIYGLYGNNFPKRIIALARKRENLRVVADQIGAPTSADLVADITAHCLDRYFTDPTNRELFRGLYHLAPNGEVSWHGYALEILQTSISTGLLPELKPECLQAISTADYPTAAKRPANSRLNTDKLAKAFQLSLPPWQLQVRRLVTEIGEAQIC